MDNDDRLETTVRFITATADLAKSELARVAIGTWPHPTSLKDISERRAAWETSRAIERFLREVGEILAAHQYIAEEKTLDDGRRSGVPRKRHLARLYATAKSPRAGKVLAAAAKAVADEAYSHGVRDEKVAEVVPEEYLRQYFTLSSMRKKQVAEALRNGDTWDTVMRRM